MAAFETIFVDIGEGDSTLIRLPGDHYVLIDVFRCEGHGINLFKLLDDRLPEGKDGRKRLEILIITHAHDDHIRGLKDLAERYEIGAIWAPKYETDASLGERFDEFKEVMEGHDHVVIQKGSRTPIAYLGDDESVTVRCFSPPGYIDVDEKVTEQEQRAKVHEHCGVYKFEFAGVSVMFAGDSDLNCWKRIIGYYKEKTDPDSNEPDLSVVDSTVLHASHHGSYTFFKNSENDDLWLDGLEVIDPEMIVVSVGPENKHDHPHDAAMKAYRDHVGEDNVQETQHAGTLVLEVEEDGNYQLLPDNGGYEDAYGWDEDDGDEADDGDGASDGGAAKRAVLKPRTRLDNAPAA
jgi:beta-lactamase superfamily II metal-dependent hydrolase